MNQEQNNIPVNTKLSSRQVAEQSPNGVSEKQKQYYLEQVRLLCPTISTESPEAQRLWTLLRKTKCIIKMLTHFDRSWEKGMPEIQKACLYFLTMDNVPRKERMETLERWAEWSVFLVGASRHRSLIGQMLQHYYFQLHDLERLVGREASETPELLTD